MALWTRVSAGSRRQDGASGAENAPQRDPGCVRKAPKGRANKHVWARWFFFWLSVWGESQILVVLGRSFQLNFIGSITMQYGKVIIESRE